MSGSDAKTVALKPSGSTIAFTALSGGNGAGVVSVAKAEVAVTRQTTSTERNMRCVLLEIRTADDRCLGQPVLP